MYISTYYHYIYIFLYFIYNIYYTRKRVNLIKNKIYSVLINIKSYSCNNLSFKQSTTRIIRH